MLAFSRLADSNGQQSLASLAVADGLRGLAGEPLSRIGAADRPPRRRLRNSLKVLGLLGVGRGPRAFLLLRACHPDAGEDQDDPDKQTGPVGGSNLASAGGAPLRFQLNGIGDVGDGALTIVILIVIAFPIGKSTSH